MTVKSSRVKKPDSLSSQVIKQKDPVEKDIINIKEEKMENNKVVKIVVGACFVVVLGCTHYVAYNFMQAQKQLNTTIIALFNRFHGPELKAMAEAQQNLQNAPMGQEPKQEAPKTNKQ